MKIFIDLKFSGNTGDRIVKNCIKKLYKCFKKEVTVKFVLHYQTTKLSYFTNTKDKTPLLSQSSVIYKFVCPGCKSCYVGKTDHTLHEKTKEHAYAKSNKNEHLPLCTHYSPVADLFKIDNNSFNSNQFNVSQIRDDNILDRGNNWDVLLFNPIQDGRGAKIPPSPTSFPPITSINVGIRLQNFLTFSFNPFDRLV